MVSTDQCSQLFLWGGTILTPSWDWQFPPQTQDRQVTLQTSPAPLPSHSWTPLPSQGREEGVGCYGDAMGGGREDAQPSQIGDPGAEKGCLLLRSPLPRHLFLHRPCPRERTRDRWEGGRNGEEQTPRRLCWREEAQVCGWQKQWLGSLHPVLDSDPNPDCVTC